MIRLGDARYNRLIRTQFPEIMINHGHRISGRNECQIPKIPVPKLVRSGTNPTETIKPRDGVDFKGNKNKLSEEHREARIEESRIFMCANSLSSKLNTRLIILEDIGPTMINLLGATVEFSPEFFEQHLHRSGDRGNEIQELPPSAWRTSNLQRNYVFLEWRRPVKCWTQEPITPSQWEDLLGNFLPHDQPFNQPYPEGTEQIEKIGDDVGGPKDTEYRLETTTNIF